MTLFTASLLALSLHAAPSQHLGDGYVAPVAGQVQLPLDGQPTQWRGRSEHFLRVLPGEDLRGTIQCVRVGNYVDRADYEVLDSGGKLVASGFVEVGQKAELHVRDPGPNTYQLVVDAHLNSATVETQVKYLFLEAARAKPLQIIYRARPLYFFVPSHAKQFTVHAAGQGKGECVAVDVVGPNGAALAHGSTVGTPRNRCAIAVEVPQELAGRAWQIVLRKAEGFLFEDCRLSISGDAPAFVADHPARLVMPLVSPQVSQSDGKVSAGISVNVEKSALAGLKLRVRVVECGNPTPVYERTLVDLTREEVAVPLEGEGLRMFTFQTQLTAADGRVVFERAMPISVAHGQLFKELPHREDHSPARPNAEDRARGFQVFTRSEPGDIRPNSRPREDELCEAVAKTAAPGEYASVNFALYPLRELSRVRVDVTDLKREGGTIPASAVELWVVRCWPQRTDWRAVTFQVVPELLEPMQPVGLRRGVPQQYYATVRVPEDAASGKYRGTIRVEADSLSSDAVRIEVEVLPFRLRTPPGIVWGLYPDSRRWLKFPDEQIEREMIDYREHGINALMMYPLAFVKFAYAGGKVSADFSLNRKIMRLYRKVGLGGTMVVSVQSSESFVRNLIGMDKLEHTPEFVDAYRQVMLLLKQESIEDNWPDYCIHSVDEPSSGARGEEAVRTLKLLKELGFRTFNTCYGRFVRDKLDTYLDFRCYNNIGFLSMRTAEGTHALRDETLSAGDVFWWYGTGCYTNGGLIQDGNVVVNRHMGGIHFWRTKATGCWAWTFLRPKGSAYDDFDGASQREHKDACIAYPTRDGRGLVSTLQWEGIREGVTDYKYLHTLQCLIEEARKSNRPEAKAAAQQAERELSAMLNELPWTCREGQFVNADADQCREKVTALMRKLWARLQD